MAAIETRLGLDNNANFNSVSEPASGNAKRTLDNLLVTNERYAAHEELITEELNDVRSQIQNLKAKEAKLVAARSQTRTSAQTNNEYRTRKLSKQLNHPASSFSEVYRSVMRSPELGGGSLQDVKVFEQAHKMAEGILSFGNQLKDSDIPQPLVLVRNVYDPETETILPQIDFAHTAPNSGLGIEVNDAQAHLVHGTNNEAFTPQTWVTLPTLKSPGPNAARQSPENSHYSFADSELVIVDHGNSLRSFGLANPVEMPTVGEMRISVPMGNLYKPNVESSPFIMYDNSDGAVEVIERPVSLQSNLETRLCAVGERAVRAALRAVNETIIAQTDPEKVEVLKVMTNQIETDKLGLG
jgi:hypothetical protein